MLMLVDMNSRSYAFCSLAEFTQSLLKVSLTSKLGAANVAIVFAISLDSRKGAEKFLTPPVVPSISHGAPLLRYIPVPSNSSVCLNGDPGPPP